VYFIFGEEKKKERKKRKIEKEKRKRSPLSFLVVMWVCGPPFLLLDGRMVKRQLLRWGTLLHSAAAGNGSS